MQLYVLETTHRESGEVDRREFGSADERLEAFDRLDVHSMSYRFIDPVEPEEVTSC